MIQEPGRRPSSTHRRSNRAGRNRPVLVTSTENQTLVAEAGTLDSAPSSSDLAGGASPNSEQTQPASTRRSLRGFFSTVGKTVTARPSAPKASSSPAETAPARSNGQKPEAKAQPGKAAASNRPAPLFKTRYMFGMILYLLAADVIGIIETNLLQPYGGNTILAQFAVFGLPIRITVSALVYLATLIIILVVLARFDLLPRSFKALSGGSSSSQSRRDGSSSQQRTDSSANNRAAPPTRKLGVKGSNDDLYQQYQATRRRERKK